MFPAEGGLAPRFVLSIIPGTTGPKVGAAQNAEIGMLDETLLPDLDRTIADKKRAAYEMIADAMADAEAEGIERAIVTQAALFAVFIDLVSTYGETAVAELAERLPQRLLAGEFTIDRRLQ